MRRLVIPISEFSERPSGLLVPSERPALRSREWTASARSANRHEPAVALREGALPSPEIPIGVTAGLAALGLPSMPFESIRRALSAVPFVPAMHFLSQVSVELHHYPTDQARHRALANHIFSGSQILPRLLGFLSDPAHVLLDRRIVTALQRLLVTDGAQHQGDLTPEHRAVLLFALLGLVDALPDASLPDTEEETTEIVDLEPWLPFIVQLGCSAAGDVYVLDGVARAHAMYRVFAHDPQSRSHPQYCAIDNLLECAGGGLSADEQLAVALAILQGTSALDRDTLPEGRLAGLIPPTYLKDTMLADRSAEAFSMLAADRQWFLDQLGNRNDDLMDLAWDHTVFEQRPLLRLDDESMLLIGPTALTAWMGRGVHFRALRAAERTEDPAKRGRSMRQRFQNFSGSLGERYVRSLVEHSLEASISAGAVTVSGDQPYKIRRQEHRAPDVAVASGPDLVLVEVCHSRLRLDARTATAPERVREQIDKLVTRKLGELDDRIAEILDPKLQLRLEGIDSGAVRRVMPVLVLSGDALTIEPVLLRHVAATRPGLFADARVQRPVITDLDGLERALALCEHHGLTLAGLLGDFVAETGGQVPLLNWIARRYRPPADLRPTFVETMFDQAVGSAVERLFPGAAARWRTRRDEHSLRGR